ncbi:MAG TPA: PD-(D/E)XK nuclease family protein [Vicinamibacterales bacterium]|nr:PD-(D/E)XK nuclease family protein [Vicinamibacterales bacterium]HOQ59694.1 PD-(D/E)XK nuclease family protein [Vicinamibacterales bacterium]HPK71223.1 PD-(D/E)XK nuclease family protein [Vicinamibacterales bacterium]
MIAPRSTRLVRAPDAAAFRRVLVGLALSGTLAAIRRRALVLPSLAAADAFRRSLEEAALADGLPGAVAIPHLVTRDGWMAALQDAMPGAGRRASGLEREVLLRASAETAGAAGAPPPFTLRPGLVAEMLAFYDAVRRHGRSVDDLERVAVGELERAADSDRGAARMLAQTRFLVASFRDYESRLAAAGAADEHTLRRALLEAPGSPFDHVVVAVGDRAGEPAGLWPSDYDLLARVPGLSRLDIVATAAALGAGLLDRLRRWLPGLDETDAPLDPVRPPPPELLAPPGEASPPYWRARDREDELADVARTVKRASRTDPAEALGRTAVVFKRPLPYVYLSRRVFASAGVPYQVFDALPLAAEPFAAAVDLAFDAAESGFSRAPLTALLRSPLLQFSAGGRRVGAADAALLDRKLSEARYLAAPEDLPALAASWISPAGLHRAALAAAAVAEELAPLAREEPPTVHLDALRRFLDAHHRPPGAAHETRDRQLRVRAAVLSALARLRDAHARLDDRPRPFEETAALLRRWIEAQTFAPREGSAGVQLVDAEAARFGDFDTLNLVGLTEQEWPEGRPRSIFYPASMLADLGWPADADGRAAERAAFDDLLRSARRTVRVSTITLEEDAIVEPSPFLDDLARCGLRVRRAPREPLPRVLAGEALVLDPPQPPSAGGPAAAWLALRLARTPADDARFHGSADPVMRATHRVSAIDRYLACPFAYFAEHVLRLAEEPEDEEALAPRAQGTLVHAVLEAFYREWQARGCGAVTPENLPEARGLFASVALAHLASLPPGDAALERARLLGSPAAEGCGDIALSAEAERDRGVAVVERLLEHALDGDTPLGSGPASRTIRLSAKADRIDLFADGTFRVIDYKLSRAPALRHVVQLPAYAAAARERLAGRHGRSWRASDAAYLSFGRSGHYEPIAAGQERLDAALAAGEARLLGAVAQIEQGAFPVAPVEPHRCRYCPFAGVCRKEFAGDE